VEELIEGGEEAAMKVPGARLRGRHVAHLANAAMLAKCST
jgi:hypothetical protein